MEKKLRFVLMPTLEQMALRRIAIALSSGPDYLEWIANTQFQPHMGCRNIWEPEEENYDFLKEAEFRRTVEDRLLTLPLHESHKKQMVPTFKAVFSEIFIWKTIYADLFSDTSIDSQQACLQRLCWTPAGAVDCRRTAERLVTFDALDLEKRFSLACVFCLEEPVLRMWEKLTSEVGTLQPLLLHMLERQTEMKSNGAPSRNAFEKSALCGLKTMTEFFFGKLTKEEREASLVPTAKKVLRCRTNSYVDFEWRKKKLTDVLCYLLTLMTPEEQMDVFRELPCEVLRCFLDWPWQDLFLDVVDVLWAFLSENEYKTVVYCIYIYMRSSGYYFENLIQDFFLHSPRDFRKYFVNDEVFNAFIFWRFVENEDTDTIIVMLRNLDAADRVSLVFSEVIFLMGYPFMDWRKKEALLRAAELSKADTKRLKEVLMETDGLSRLSTTTRERFFQFVEESAEKSERLEEGKRAKTKNSSVKMKKKRLRI